MTLIKEITFQDWETLAKKICFVFNFFHFLETWVLEETGKFPSLIALRFLISLKKAIFWGISLVVQWLRLHASTSGGKGSILGWETKIPYGAAKK